MKSKPRWPPMISERKMMYNLRCRRFHNIYVSLREGWQAKIGAGGWVALSTT